MRRLDNPDDNSGNPSSTQGSSEKRRLAVIGIAAALVGVAGVLAAVTLFGGSSTGGKPATKVLPVAIKDGAVPGAAATTTETTQTNAGGAELQKQLTNAAASAVTKASSEFNGKTSVAVFVSGAAQPSVVGADDSQPKRLWSLSKPVTAIAALKAAEATPQGASPQLQRAIDDAITKSSNCGQRRVALGLQTLAKGSSGAESEFNKVLATAGVQAAANGLDTGTTNDCARYIKQVNGSGQPDNQPSVYFGTAQWTVADAARFALALGDGKYGKAGEFVKSEMSKQKQLDDTTDGVMSGQAQPGQDYTVNSVDWGAGNAFGEWNPAWKAGWGGSDAKQFQITQIATFKYKGLTVAVVARFAPSAPTTSDDPGKTTGPRAIESVFTQMASKLN